MVLRHIQMYILEMFVYTYFMLNQQCELARKALFLPAAHSLYGPPGWRYGGG